MKLIVGLGNPGRQYENTRHNFGFLALDHIAAAENLNWQDDSKFKGLWAQGFDTTGEKFFLLKPQTYMNLSGESVRAFINFYKITAENILAVHDEIDLPFGRFKFSRGGGAAGNNGIRSLIQHIGTQKFPRLRLGVGRPSHAGQAISDYVLQKFSKSEWPAVEDLLISATQGIEFFLQNSIDTTMNQFNQK